MSSLITGATGFIGSHLTEYLLAQGEHVRCLVRPGHTQPLPFAENGNLTITRGDLTDPASLEQATQGVSVVYHAAALLRAVNSHTLAQINVTGVKNLLEACVKNNVDRLVFISSVAAYAPSAATIITEDAPLGGAGAYGRSKANAEAIIRVSAKSTGLRYSIIRPCVVYGPRDSHNFTPRLLRLLNRKVIPTITRPDHLGLVYVTDVVRAAVLAGNKTQAVNRVYNITGGPKTSLQHIVKIYQELTGQQKITVPLPASLVHFALLGRWLTGNISRGQFHQLGNRYQNREFLHNFFIQNHHYDIRKAQTELGYKPAVHLREGLQQTLDWYRHR